MKNAFKRIGMLTLASILTLALALSLGACTDEPGDNSNLIVVGIDAGFPPIGYKDNGVIVGFDVDLARAVITSMGYTAKFQEINWANKENELNSGKIDIVWNGLTITDERKENMLISKPYLKNSQIVIVADSSSYQTLADLDGKKIVAQKQSTAVDAIADSDLAGSPLTTLADNLRCLEEMIQGKADAFVVDEVVGNWMLANNANGKNFRVLTQRLAEEEYGIAVKKGNTELMTKITQTMDMFAEEGRLAGLSMFWFGEDITIWTV